MAVDRLESFSRIAGANYTETAFITLFDFHDQLSQQL